MQNRKSASASRRFPATAEPVRFCHGISLCRRCSGGDRGVRDLLGAVPRTASNDGLHRRRSMDASPALHRESAFLHLRSAIIDTNNTIIHSLSPFSAALALFALLHMVSFLDQELTSHPFPLFVFSSVTYAIGIRSGLQFCRSQKSRDIHPYSLHKTCNLFVNIIQIYTRFFSSFRRHLKTHYFQCCPQRIVPNV